MVIAEAGWLIERQLGATAEATFYRSIAAGELHVEPFADSDWPRIAELVETYADLGLGGTDASLVAIAERLNITTIATLDHRDFTVVRPRHVNAFTLLPKVRCAARARTRVLEVRRALTRDSAIWSRPRADRLSRCGRSAHAGPAGVTNRLALLLR